MKKNIQQILIIFLMHILVVPLFSIKFSFLSLRYENVFYFDGILIHTLLYMCLVYTIMSFTKKINFSYIFVNFFEWLFGTISLLKIATRGQEFVPWDLALTRNALDLISFAQITPELIISLILRTFFIITITFIQIYLFNCFCKIPEKSGKYLILGITAVSFIFFPVKYKVLRMKYIVPERKGFENYGTYKGMNYYGAFFNFILDLGTANVEKAEEYSREKILEIQKKHENYQINGTNEYDNVVLILMESFVDLEKILQEKFEKDIIPNYHKYESRYTNDKMKVDVIGGGTANVEYQVLTMQGLENYPEGIFPYMHYINENIEALPQVFKDNGYCTTAIHTYKEGFYNRDNVFELMGFDKYISDDDFTNPDYYGEYIDDLEIYNKIVETLEKEDKSFIHAITMSAHSPYNLYFSSGDTLKGERYGEYATAINNYLYSLKRTDEMLGKLIEYIEKTDEKTLLIVYGDHFPLLTICLDDINLIEKGETCISVEKYPELYEAPYMVVSNVESEIESHGDIKPNEMGMYILDNVKIEKLPWIYKVYHNYFKNQKEKEYYDIIQYDELHGEKYWKGM